MENRIERILILPLQGDSFSEQFLNCHEQVSQHQANTGSLIIQQSYFIDAPDNTAYLALSRSIMTELEKSGTPVPSTSIIAQAPAGGHKLSLELIIARQLSPGTKLTYETEQNIHYTRIDNESGKEIYAGGITSGRPFEPFIEQVRKSYELLESILKREGMEFSDIVRQWNYVEAILSVHPVREEQIQNYQILNDIRSGFYAKSNFTRGYPAATGIGMNSGGLVLEVYAVSREARMLVVPVRNPLQVDAYHYSEDVLVGNSLEQHHKKTTPKFERAKYAGIDGYGTVYISGTASIQDEKTIGVDDIKLQSEITIQNISNLIHTDNLNKAGVPPFSDIPQYRFIRVYIKNRKDVLLVRRICDAFYGDIPVHYLIADVCRNNLLVEIEGVAEVGQHI